MACHRALAGLAGQSDYTCSMQANLSANPIHDPARTAAVAMVRRLREAGYVAFLAGGCVRDALLGQHPKDYDIATDARPRSVRGLFPRSRYVGEAFGVVLVQQDAQAVEVATFRRDGVYRDGRRPSDVVFCSAQEDARRRDLTINGLFADPLVTDPSTGMDTIHDYVDGVADLRAGIVRAIGDPDQRFGEDYLRMLRTVRFAARLDFTVDPATAAAIKPLAKYLGQISRERIGAEVGMMLDLPGAQRGRAVQLMGELMLDGAVLQEENRHAATSVLAGMADQACGGAMLAAWFLDRYADISPQLSQEKCLQALCQCVLEQGPRRFGRWRRALCLSNEQRDQMRDALTLAQRAVSWESLDCAGRKRLLAHPRWEQASFLLAAVAGSWTAHLQTQAEVLFAQGVAPPPLLTGRDLIACGRAPGPVFGDLLDRLYDAQLNGEITTRQQALQWLEGHAPAT